jgi:CheY-like chemotaxis protein
MNNVRTIFVVDDDPDDKEIFAEAIKRVDPTIQCFTAADGGDALQKLNDALIIPDLIFLDLNMPRVDGRQFLVEMKKDSRFSQIPVIIYSTSAMKRDIDETIQLGASLFLQKPSDMKELCKALAGIISR